MYENGSSLSEWLALYRSRREPTEVAVYQAALPEPVLSEVSGRRIAAIRISRYDDPDNPNPAGGFYLFGLNDAGESVTDTWREDLDDAFDQAEYEFGVPRSDWTPASPDA